MSDAVFRLENVAYRYAGRPDPAFRLEIAALTVRAGEVLALVGPNGAGKTTLLWLLAFLARPAAGRIEFLGGDPWADGDRVVEARRQAVLVTHHPYLFKGSVGDNIAFGLRLRKAPEAEVRGRVRSALALVELDGWEKRHVAGLSAGQAQRVALARALALRPKVLLLDEPTANLDAALGMRMEALLRETGPERGTTVVFSTHNFSQASRLAGGILFLSEGRRVEFSHENCFSGTADTDGRTSWIEPRPGVRIVFTGARRGHVTCVIDPAAIRIMAAAPGTLPDAGPNVFRGRITRMETTDAATALVRTSGEIVLRAALPLGELEAGGVSLSKEVLLRFDPEAVEVVGDRPADGETPA
jgi:tungstate transport system ATP-binding protein